MQSGGDSQIQEAAEAATKGDPPSSLLPSSEPQAEQQLDIFGLLRRQHPPGEWAFMEEVGYRPAGDRFADAVAVNLWRSRGHVIHGFEVKVSRGDWLRELKQPEKSEPVLRYCHFWWLVAEPGITKPGELPDNWGHVERRGQRLQIVKAAPRMQPNALTLEFFASLMRRGHAQVEGLAAVRYADKLLEAERAIEARVREAKDRATRHADARCRELEQTVARFKAETGIDIGDRYNGPPVATIKLAEKLQQLDVWRGTGALARLTDLAQQLESAAATVRSAIAQTGLSGSSAS